MKKGKIKGNRGVTYKVNDDDLTFMDEFAMLDEDVTQASSNKRPARRAGGNGSGKNDTRRAAGKKVRKREPLRTRLRASVTSLSKTEQAVIAAGIAIAVIGVSLGTVLIQARTVGNALRSFAEIGDRSVHDRYRRHYRGGTGGL